MKDDKICQHKKELGGPLAIKVGMISIWHLPQCPGQRCDLRQFPHDTTLYPVVNSHIYGIGEQKDLISQNWGGKDENWTLGR